MAEDSESKDEVQAVAGYDKDGNAQVFQLAKGEKLPSGFADKPPKGTHPHEREKAAAQAADAPVQQEMKLDIPEPSDDMTKEELIEFAQKYGVEISHHWTKAQIIDAIEDAR